MSPKKRPPEATPRAKQKSSSPASVPAAGEDSSTPERHGRKEDRICIACDRRHTIGVLSLYAAHGSSRASIFAICEKCHRRMRRKRAFRRRVEERIEAIAEQIGAGE